MAVNARDAMDGEGILTISVNKAGGMPAIRGHSAVTGDFVAITVNDTGEGIALEQIDRIFEPFYTTKGVGQSTGLGLSQAIGFAKQANGDIDVQSILGAGASFTLYLPRTYPVGAIEREAIVNGGRIDGNGLRVLVVDDNLAVGDFAASALKELGYATMKAANAMEALAMLEKNGASVQIIFSDVVMPGMNGIEMAKRIRELYPDLPVVLTSGYSHVLAQNGAEGFDLLHKPYSLEQLSKMLQRHSTRAAARMSESRRKG